MLRLATEIQQIIVSESNQSNTGIKHNKRKTRRNKEIRIKRQKIISSPGDDEKKTVQRSISSQEK